MRRFSLSVLWILALGWASTARGQVDVIPRGRIIADTIAAPALAGNLLGDPTRQPALIYLPPGYHTETERRYPVVVLLHGILDSPSVWTHPESYQGMTVQAVMDSLIAAGEIGETIVVMPNGKNAYGGSMYMNSVVGGNWEDYVVRDVVAHADGTYRTIPAAASRAVTGHSMGGFGAVRLAMLHPDVFSVAWGMNPCCLCCIGQETPADDPVWRRMEEFETAADLWKALEEDGEIWPLIVAAVGAALSPDPEHPPLLVRFPYALEDGRVVATDAAEPWNEALPLAEVADHVDGLRRLRGLGFDSAFGDEFVHIPTSTDAFSDSLVALEVPHVFEVYAGDHRNRMRERFSSRVLPWIDERLAREAHPSSR